MATIARTQMPINLAAVDEVAKNNVASELYLNLTNDNDSSLILTHLKKVNTPSQVSKQMSIVDQFKYILIELNKVKSGSPTAFKLKKSYNHRLNCLLGILDGNSTLSDLLFINEQNKYITKRESRIRERVDFNDAYGKIVGEGPFTLHTSGPSSVIGGRTEFESPEACLSAMRACIERCVSWEEHVNVIIEGNNLYLAINKHDYGRVKILGSVYSLKIQFQGSPYWIDSDSSKLKHILCGENPPNRKKDSISFKDKYFSHTYPFYSEFLQLVEKQIHQLVKNSHNNNCCRYTVIPCCRTEPICNGETFCLKPSMGGSNCVKCTECHMELCAKGCGRIHHGDSPCEMTNDEASEAFIQESSKICPRCGILTYKFTGCNHMTCRCGCEFCWICGDELPRDRFDRYSTNLHFRRDTFGIGVENGCRQFDD